MLCYVSLLKCGICVEIWKRKEKKNSLQYSKRLITRVEFYAVRIEIISIKLKSLLFLCSLSSNCSMRQMFVVSSHTIMVALCIHKAFSIPITSVLCPFLLMVLCICNCAEQFVMWMRVTFFFNPNKIYDNFMDSLIHCHKVE